MKKKYLRKAKKMQVSLFRVIGMRNLNCFKMFPQLASDDLVFESGKEDDIVDKVAIRINKKLRSSNQYYKKANSLRKHCASSSLGSHLKQQK
ncbi:hypothetical protein [Taibaiella helva]|uniref:hypothetical protein n=1 Tax=Taibaiella helva TaxID=2301235 RepID=UPI000E56744F|nr:hypothetical protein [Taibaiella helva]